MPGTASQALVRLPGSVPGSVTPRTQYLGGSSYGEAQYDHCFLFLQGDYVWILSELFLNCAAGSVIRETFTLRSGAAL